MTQPTDHETPVTGLAVTLKPVFSPEEAKVQEQEANHFIFVNSRVKDLFDTLSARPEATEEWRAFLETNKPFVTAFLELAETPDKHQWNLTNLKTTIDNHKT